MRSYFRYRTTCGDQVGELTTVISNPVNWKLASLPRALRPDEADRLLKSFATARRWQKRGYAIVRCALDLGLRAGEIAHLMISDIDWHVGTVILRGTKSLRHDILPLPIETGQALADYLQHERPWLRLNPQFEATSALLPNRNGQAMTRTNVALRLALAVQSATGAFPDLAKRRVSPHTIRHTTAMHLLQAGVDISVIALWLGHESPVTTHHYVEADLTMKERALAKLHEPTAKIQRYRASICLHDWAPAATVRTTGSDGGAIQGDFSGNRDASRPEIGG